MAAIKSIQFAVGVFLEKLKIRHVVLDAIAVQIAENAHSGLFVDKQEASKVRVELLNPRPRRNEVIVGAEIVQLYFDESFLQAQVVIETVGSAPHVWSHDAQLSNFQVIQAEFGRDANAPVHRLERRIAVK